MKDGQNSGLFHGLSTGIFAHQLCVVNAKKHLGCIEEQFSPSKSPQGEVENRRQCAKKKSAAGRSKKTGFLFLFIAVF